MYTQFVRRASAAVISSKGKLPSGERCVSIVTGSSRGVGAQTALRLAEQKHHIVLHYYSQRDAAEELAERCAKLGADPVIYQADLAKPRQCYSLIEMAAKRFGYISYLVNNAGTTVFTKPEDLETQTQHYDTIMALNLNAAFHLSMQATQHMPEAGGAIVNVASNAANTGIGSSIPYTISKAGIVALTKAMAAGFKHRNIRVNAVCPGMIDTPSWWEKRFPESPEKLAEFMEKQQDNMVSADWVAEQIITLLFGNDNGLSLPLLANQAKEPQVVLKPSS